MPRTSWVSVRKRGTEKPRVRLLVQMDADGLDLHEYEIPHVASVEVNANGQVVLTLRKADVEIGWTR